MKKRTIASLAALAATIGASSYLMWENYALKVTRYEYVSERVPAEFDGFKIALLADLHERSFGSGNADLLAALREISPDAIMLAGDIYTKNSPKNPEPALSLARGVASIAPSYYVAGNHEAKADKAAYLEFRRELEKEGVRALDDERIVISLGASRISLLGLRDFKFDERSYGKDPQVSADFRLSHLMKGVEDMSVLLVHRPEQLDAYSRCGVDLVLAGHTHGGQWRIPFLGAFFIPNQGFFPEISDGVYKKGATTMIVTTGLGASNVDLRLFNRPEIALVTLRRAAQSDGV